MSKIYSRSSWNAQNRNGVGSRPVGRLEKYGHHTVTTHLPQNATVAQEKAQMRTIERIGQQRFGAGISYNFIIFPSGRIYEGASVNRIAYHSGSGRNTRGVGFCFAGNYDTNKVGKKALEAAVWLLQEGVRRGWWGDPALTEMHRDFSSTACPGRYLYSEFGNINRRGRGQTVTPKPSKPKEAKAWPQAALPVTDEHTTASHNAWVKLLTDVGYIDSSLTLKFQKWLRDLGYYKGRIDDVFGGWTVDALQRFLRDKGLYSGRIDGKRLGYRGRGPMTIRAEIDYLNSQRRFYS